MLFSDIDLNKNYSYADYFSWQFEERVELINGKVYKMSPAPSSYHQDIVLDIATSLKNHLHGKKCKVYVAPFDVRLPKKGVEDKSIFTVLQPDVCVICDLEKIDKRGCIGAPDIVVEVLSPGNNNKELKNKYEAYEAAGVQEYWVVSPQIQSVTLYVLTDGKFQSSRMLSTSDIVTSSVLPGFSLDLSELFQGLDGEEE
jgi:Uma2 family endonuclease